MQLPVGDSYATRRVIIAKTINEITISEAIEATAQAPASPLALVSDNP